jgi:hypothetical protein
VDGLIKAVPSILSCGWFIGASRVILTEYIGNYSAPVKTP